MRERVLRRAVLCSIVALSAAGAMSATASASSRTVIPVIQGAGKVSANGRSCSQGAGVTNATVLECPNPWYITLVLQGVDLVATPAPGWVFAEWSGCPGSSGNTCSYVVPSQNIDVTSKPVARFVDKAAP